MEKHVGPMQIECDSPPYCVVQATEQIGIVDPEDVRWARLSRHVLGWAARQPHGRPGRMVTCVCGRPLPGLSKATFTFDTGASLSCLLGQCQTCKAVYWEEA